MAGVLTTEALLDKFEHDGAFFWVIHYGTGMSGGKASEYMPETEEGLDENESRHRLERALELLPPGKYKLTARKKRSDNKGVIITFFEQEEAYSNAPAVGEPYGQGGYLMAEIAGLRQENAAILQRLHQQQLDTLQHQVDELKRQLAEEAQPSRNEAMILGLAERLLPSLLPQQPQAYAPAALHGPSPVEPTAPVTGSQDYLEIPEHVDEATAYEVQRLSLVLLGRLPDVFLPLLRQLEAADPQRLRALFPSLKAFL
ncbi:MAG: hypothetical protein SFY70_01780 [Bacteroidia bacterium]|nr:hypothetical protein [Bacteroidia bacterium]